VDPLVLTKGRALVKCFSTLNTLVGFFSSVSYVMSDKG
jgi:hypothetical protein